MLGLPRSVLGKLRAPRPAALNIPIVFSPRSTSFLAENVGNVKQIGFHHTQAKRSTPTDASGSPKRTARREKNKNGAESDMKKDTTDSDLIDIECMLGSFKAHIKPEHMEEFLAYLHGEDGEDGNDDGASTASTVACNLDCGNCKAKSSQTRKECDGKVDNHDVQTFIGVEGSIGFAKFIE